MAYHLEHLLLTSVAVHLTEDGGHLRTDEEHPDGTPASQGRLHGQTQDLNLPRLLEL